jgi:thioredoxin 2
MPAAIVVCPNCGKKNRTPAVAEGAPRCGNCHQPLPWIVDADASEFEGAIHASVPVLVDFWAPWCGPCRLVSPVIEAVGEAHADKIATAKVNTDENQGLAMRYSIFSIPTMIVFKDGREAARLVGYMPQAALEERLRDFLS